MLHKTCVTDTHIVWKNSGFRKGLRALPFLKMRGKRDGKLKR